MRKKIKICFFNVSMNIGGVERQLIYIINNLSSEKYTKTLILCKKEGQLLDDVDASVMVKNLSIKYRPVTQVGIMLSLWKLLKNDTPNILFCFNVKLIGCCAFVCKLLKIDLICRIQGYFYKGKLNCLRKIYFRVPHSFIAVSEGVKVSMVNCLGKKFEKKIIVVHNGIEYEKILKMSKKQQDSALFTENQPIIMTIGRLTKEKRFDVIIKAMKLLRTQCSLGIIGDGPEKRRLEQLCCELGLEDRVRFTGMKNNPFQYLVDASVFVLASEAEGFPNVILEAKALKIPCICANFLGGTAGIVEDNVDGFVFKTNDVEDLAKRIDTLLDDKFKRNYFRDNGFYQITNWFRMDKMLKNYERFIENVGFSGGQGMEEVSRKASRNGEDSEVHCNW